MARFPAWLLRSAIRDSIAGAVALVALVVLVHPAAANLLEFTFVSTFSGFTGAGSFFLDTSVAAQPGGPGPSPTYPTLYPNAIKNYQYSDLFQSSSLLEANLFVWPDRTIVQGLPSLTEFDFPDFDGLATGLSLNLADQPSLGFQLSSDPTLYQLNSFWASFVNNSPFDVTALEVKSVVPEPSTLLLAGTALMGALWWTRRQQQRRY